MIDKTNIGIQTLGALVSWLVKDDSETVFLLVVGCVLKAFLCQLHPNILQEIAKRAASSYVFGLNHAVVELSNPISRLAVNPSIL